MGKPLIILSPGFPANEADSTCMPFPQLFVKTLKQLHPSLHIIVIAFQYPFERHTYDWNGVEVMAFNGRSKGKIHRLLLWQKIRRQLRQIIKANDVAGILNFWLGECALMGKLISRKYQLRNYTWLLGQDAKKDNRYFSLIKPGTDELIALSDALADTLWDNYGIRPAHIIPPGIDEKDFPAAAPQRDIDILAAGSLIPLKQYEIFIRIVARLVKIHPAIKTMICGDGPERNRLQEMINKEGVAANITLSGELGHAQVLQMMNRSRVFLHPSSYEGFATVLTEALYAGNHTVSFCQPMHQVFRHQYVVKTESAMYETVSRLVGEQHLSHDKVIIGRIEDTCQKISSLFGI